MRKMEEDQTAMLLLYGRSVLLGGAGALALGLLLLFLAAIGISKGILDADLRDQLVVVVSVLSSFCGALYAVRCCPSRGLFVGLAVGGMLFLLQLAIGLLLFDSDGPETGWIGLLCGALCGGAAAGILAGGGKKRPSKGKKRCVR